MFHFDRPHPHVFALRMRSHRMMRRVVLGTVLVAIGLAHLLEQQGLIARHDLWLIAPAALVLSAIGRLAVWRDARAVGQAIVRCAIAAYLVVGIEHLGGWTFHDTWPVLLIVLGSATIGRALLERKVREEPNW